MGPARVVERLLASHTVQTPSEKKIATAVTGRGEPGAFAGLNEPHSSDDLTHGCQPRRSDRSIKTSGRTARRPTHGSNPGCDNGSRGPLDGLPLLGGDVAELPFFEDQVGAGSGQDAHALRCSNAGETQRELAIPRSDD